MSVTADTAVPSSPGLAPGSPAPDRRRSARWSAMTGALGAVSGVAPHVLHHVGPLVGAAVLTGAAGTAAFGSPACSSRSRSCSGYGDDSARGGLRRLGSRCSPRSSWSRHWWWARSSVSKTARRWCPPARSTPSITSDARAMVVLARRARIRQGSMKIRGDRGPGRRDPRCRAPLGRPRDCAGVNEDRRPDGTIPPTVPCALVTARVAEGADRGIEA